MGLTEDQKAMLRLLAQREEGYEDMAALMGISVEEVRDRVKEALAEVDEGEQAPAAPSEPAPAPPPPAPAAPPAEEGEPPAEPPPPAPVEPSSEQAPAAPRPPQPKRRPAGLRPEQLPGLKVPKDRGALIGLGAGALAVLAFVVVLLVAGGGDSGSSTSTSTTAAETPESTVAASENPNLTQAVLAAADGSGASGNALFGRFKKNVLLQVTATGLDPSSKGESYAVWLSHSGSAMVPVGTAKAPDSGDMAARFQVPASVLVLVARGAFNEVSVTRTTDSALSAAIAKARKSRTESAYTGTAVLRGEITGPLVGAAASKKQG